MPDIDPQYLLEIDHGENHREYRLGPNLETERGNSDVLPIVELWVFLRQLFSSKKAIDPQPTYDAYASPER